MRVMAKDRIGFAVPALGGAVADMEIRVQPDRFGSWRASVLLQLPDAAPQALGRTFRSKDRRLAAGKLVAWVRRRYLEDRLPEYPWPLSRKPLS